MRVRLADEWAAADLAGYLARLTRYDRAAVVRLRGGGGVLAVFARPPLDVIVLRTVALAEPVPPDVREIDATVSAGALRAGLDGPVLTVPPSVTGPPWSGLLPPRGGWREVLSMPTATVRELVAAGVAEGRRRIEALAEHERDQVTLDAIAASLWSRPIGGSLPLRAAHAAQMMGFIQRPDRGGDQRSTGEQVTVHAAGRWLRLETTYGSVLVHDARSLPLIAATTAYGER